MTFHEDLKTKVDTYAHRIYQASKHFPREEIYGITSQLRRASLSVALNYIEGYARMKSKVHKNFLEISYGSLKESAYLIEFCHKENLLTTTEHEELSQLSNDIGAMLWGILKKLK